MKHPVCAIDFGTTHSVVGYYDHQKAKVVLINQGKWSAAGQSPYLIPSVVGWFNDHFEVGQIAINADWDLSHNVYHLKDLIGKDYQYQFYDQNQQGQRCDVVHLISILFNHLLKLAQNQLQQTVEDLVLSVPAYFNQSQINSVKQAATLAGWKVIKIFFEPSCAASYYFHYLNANQSGDFKTTLIIDLGGGTLDLMLGVNHFQYFEPLKMGGKLALGGKDWDDVIAQWLYKTIQNRYEIDLTHNQFLKRQILTIAKQVKEQLSYQHQVAFKIHGLYDQSQSQISGEFVLTREQLMNLSSHLHDHFRQAILNLCGANIDQVDQVFLVGGAMKMPTLQAIVNELFLKKTKLIDQPELVVIYGMAIWLKDYYYRNSQVIVKPLLNLPIGIAINNDEFAVLVNAHTPLPVSHSRIFQTKQAGQNLAKIQVAQGVDPDFKNNHLLGVFLIQDLATSNLEKFNQIKLTIIVNQDYQAHLIVENLQTGYYQKLALKPPYRYWESQFVLDYLKQQQRIQSANLVLLEAITKAVKQLQKQISALANDQLYLEMSQQLLSAALVAIEQSDFATIKSLDRDLQKQIKTNEEWLNHQQSVSD